MRFGVDGIGCERQGFRCQSDGAANPETPLLGFETIEDAARARSAQERACRYGALARVGIGDERVGYFPGYRFAG